MEKSNSIKIMAEFMIALFIFLPLYVADVHAQFGQPHVEITKFQGEDGIEGYIHSWQSGSGDTLDIEVNAYYPDPAGGDDVIEGDQLRIYVSDEHGTARPETPFTDSDCTLSGGGVYKCSTQKEFDWITGTDHYEVRLYSDSDKDDENAVAASTDSADLVVDSLGAVLTSVSVSPTTLSSGSISIEVEAEDYALSPGDKSRCAGIETVDLAIGSAGGTPIHTFVFPPNTCNIRESFDYDISGLTDGDYKLCAVATDYFGQRSADAAKCADFSVDVTPPGVLASSLSIVRRDNGEALQYVGDEDVPVDITLRIQGADLNTNNVKADFSNLGGVRYTAVSPNFAASVGGGEYSLKWNNIKIGGMSTCSFTISATDLAGNPMQEEVICSITADSLGPEIQEIVTDVQKKGIYYLGKNSTLIAKIKEAGAGLSKGLIKMDLSDIVGEKRNADSCAHTGGDNWECYWNINLLNRPDIQRVSQVTVLRESFDDIFNMMPTPYRQDIGIDTRDPEISGINLSSHIFGGSGESFGEGIFVKGDTIEVILEVSDDYDTRANLTQLGGQEDQPADSCWDEDDRRLCKWIIPIGGSGLALSTDIDFTITDFAGNVVTISMPINISGLDNDTNPDFWKTENVVCYPEASRQLTLQAPGGFRVFCSSELTSRDPGYVVETYFMDMPDFTLGCFMDRVNSVKAPEEDIIDYISDVKLVNSYAGSTTPYFAVNLAETDFADIGNFSITCTMNLFSRVQEPVTDLYTYSIYPESQNITMHFEIYDLPYGDIGDAYDDELEEIFDGIERWNLFITDWWEWYKYLVDLCAVQNAIVSALATITALASLIGAIFVSGGTATAYLDTAWRNLCYAEGAGKETVLGQVNDFFQQLCGVVNCKWSDAFGDRSRNALGGYLENVEAIFGDPMDSFYLSTFMLCLPGLIKNSYTYRELYCMKAYCYLSFVPQGWPVEACDSTFDYFYCVFHTGQLFALIPFAHVFQLLHDMIFELFSDPGNLISYIFTLVGVCSKEDCHQGRSKVSGKIGCMIWYTLDMIGKAVADYEKISDMEGLMEPIEDAFCEMLDDEFGDEYDVGLD